MIIPKSTDAMSRNSQTKRLEWDFSSGCDKKFIKYFSRDKRIHVEMWISVHYLLTWLPQMFMTCDIK